VAADVDLPGVTGNPYPAMRAAAVLVLTSRFNALLLSHPKNPPFLVMPKFKK
jgi:hypothetical protein